MKARRFLPEMREEYQLDHAHHIAIDEQDRLWLPSGCSKNRIWRAGTDGALELVEWTAPAEFVLETVAPDGRGGLWILSADRTLWLASPGPGSGAPRPVADVGSESGACAVAADGSLYFSGHGADGGTLWHLPYPSAAVPKIVEPTLVAKDLGDVYGVAIAADGTLLVSDWEGGRVLALPPASESANATSWTRTPRVLATGLVHPSGLLALEDGSVIVKESGRQENGTPRLRRVAPDGKVTLWIELRRDDTAPSPGPAQR